MRLRSIQGDPARVREGGAIGECDAASAAYLAAAEVFRETVAPFELAVVLLEHGMAVGGTALFESTELNSLVQVFRRCGRDRQSQQSTTPLKRCETVGGSLMSAVQLLLVAAPLRLTLWVVAVAAGVVVLVIGIGVSRHLEWIRLARRRERVHGQLEPMFSRFFDDEDPSRLAEELRPVFLRMDAAERPVAAVLVTDVMRQSPNAHREELRRALELSGIVELGEKGTRRLSPWRRALACEMLGKIGSPHALPALLERLRDRRPEVRMAAVYALGDIGSADAVPALSEAFLECRVAPTNVVNDALRRIGGEESGATFERGVASPDPVVRVSSCYGLAAVASTHGPAVNRLAEVLASDPDARVRAAAAAGLGIAGGGRAPAVLVAAAADRDDNVRRSAVRALGSFDDPDTIEKLDERTEDEDREVAIRAAESLVALAHSPRAATKARVRLENSSAWAVEYARKVAEVGG